MASGDFSNTISLLQQAKSGNVECLGALVDAYRDRLLRRIRMMMGPSARARAESSDFLQELMVDMLKGLQSFKPTNERSFLSWLLQIARNNVIDAVSKPCEARFADIVATTLGVANPRDDDPAMVAAAHEAEERLLHALEQLPEEHQVILELRDFEQLSFAEIGARMGRSENAAQLLHARAKVRLGTVLSQTTS